MKLIIVFFAVLMGCFTIGTGDVDQDNMQDSHGAIFGVELVGGGGAPGKKYSVNCGGKGGKCSRTTHCCSELKCFVDGKCGNETAKYEEGEEVVVGVVGAWVYYDACLSTKSRIDEECTRTSDCCLPLHCDSGKCSADMKLFEILAYLRGF